MAGECTTGKMMLRPSVVQARFFGGLLKFKSFGTCVGAPPSAGITASSNRIPHV